MDGLRAHHPAFEGPESPTSTTTLDVEAGAAEEQGGGQHHAHAPQKLAAPQRQTVVFRNLTYEVRVGRGRRGAAGRCAASAGAVGAACCPVSIRACVSPRFFRCPLHLPLHTAAPALRSVPL